MARAVVKQEYQVTLRAADGKTHTWPISDCYFERKLETIGRKMLEIIRREDLTHQFSLEDNTEQQLDLNRPVQSALHEFKYRVSLIRLEDMTVHRETFYATDRYVAVSKAFKYFAHKPQADCLDTWKVYGVEEVAS